MPVRKCTECSGYGWVLGTLPYAIKCERCNGTGKARR